MSGKNYTCGDEKRDQVKTLVEFLFHLRGSSVKPHVTVNIEVEYCDWNSSEKPYLHVTQALATDLGIPLQEECQKLKAELETGGG